MKTTLNVSLYTAEEELAKPLLSIEFCKDKRTIFFSALNSTAKENLETLSRAIEVTLLTLEDIYR